MCLSTPLLVLPVAVGCGPGPGVVGLNEARYRNIKWFLEEVQEDSVMLGYCMKHLIPD